MPLGIFNDGGAIKENEVVSTLKHGLKQDGWVVKEHVKLANGFADLVVEKDGISFIIEAKGEDKGGFSSAEMNFQMGLGQLMARMSDVNRKYGLAFPLTPDFIRVLQKYEKSFAFKALDIYLFVTGSDHTYFVLPPADIPAFIDNNRI
jgi:hypothetical protein